MARTFLAPIILAHLAGAWLFPEPVGASTVDSNGPYTVLTGRLQGHGDGEALFIWSHEEQKLAVYLISGPKLKLLFVRNCKYDFQLNASIGEQAPTVKKMRKAMDPEQNKPSSKGKPAAEKESPAEGSSAENPPAAEGAAKPSQGYSLALGQFPGQGGSDVLYIWGHAKKRLAVYVIRGDVLELLFSRNCGYDFMISESLGRTTPRVETLKALTESQQKSQPAKEPKGG